MADPRDLPAGHELEDLVDTWHGLGGNWLLRYRGNRHPRPTRHRQPRRQPLRHRTPHPGPASRRSRRRPHAPHRGDHVTADQTPRQSSSEPGVCGGSRGHAGWLLCALTEATTGEEGSRLPRLRVTPQVARGDAMTRSKRVKFNKRPKYGVQACVYRLNGVWTYRWLGSIQWHYGNAYETPEPLWWRNR